MKAQTAPVIRGRESDPEALEVIAKYPSMDPRRRPQIILGPVQSRHSVKDKTYSHLRLCAVGERVFVQDDSRHRSYFGGILRVEWVGGRKISFSLFREITLTLGS